MHLAISNSSPIISKSLLLSIAQPRHLVVGFVCLWQWLGGRCLVERVGDLETLVRTPNHHPPYITNPIAAFMVENPHYSPTS